MMMRGTINNDPAEINAKCQLETAPRHVAAHRPTSAATQSAVAAGAFLSGRKPSIIC